ncbi:MAG: hypothetical protein A2X49_14520 [Lentisphaerae bacterium GWF2_52_8]|nr:MAG: hypothetical protein A2X49_14520 [Lentisphaerae bacterium GWF2_52_8]
MKNKEKNFFPFGSMYAPVARATEVPISEWEKDIAQMKQLGLTMFRSWAAWDRIERTEGVRDFTMLDHIFDVAERHGMRIMLNFGGFSSLVGCYQPEWLIKKYKCELVRTHLGAPTPEQSARRLICYDDPVFIEKAEGFLSEVIKRYSTKPALYCWLISSEPCANACMCNHSLRKFRTWLQNKYQTIENLNGVWSDEYPLAYSSWEEIEPIKMGYPCQLDWQEFSEDNLAGIIGWVNALIKKLDPENRMTTVNPNPYQLDSRSFYEKNNFWKTARSVDVLGISHYILQYPEQGRKPYVTSCYLDRVRSASQKDHFWVVETQAGPVLWDLSGDSPYHFSDDEALLHYWQMLGHGAKAITSWLYRTRIKGKQAGEFGLVAWDGSLTSRAKAVGDLSSLVQKNAKLFLDYEYKAEIAILSSYSTLRQAVLEGYENMENKKYNQRSWMGAYRLLWDLKTAADFIGDEDILEGKLARYKVLIAPFVPNMSEAIADKIKVFIEKGGCLIADFPFAYKDNNGTLQQTAPGCGLDELFGCAYSDALPELETAEKNPSGNRKESPVAPFLFTQQLKERPSAEVLSRFASGSPSLIRNKYHRGSAFMFGTMLFADYEKTERKEIREHFWSLLQQHISPRAIEIEPCDKNQEGTKNIQICELRADNKSEEKGCTLFYILNHNSHQVSLNIKAAGEIKSLEIFKPAGRELTRDLLRGQDKITLTLEAQKIVMLRIQNATESPGKHKD